MKSGDFEIHAPKKIESFKYSYKHTLKAERGKKVRGCKIGLPKQWLKLFVFQPIFIVAKIVAKSVYQNNDWNSFSYSIGIVHFPPLQKPSTKTRIETSPPDTRVIVTGIVAKVVYENKDWNKSMTFLFCGNINGCKSRLRKQGLKHNYIPAVRCLDDRRCKIGLQKQGLKHQTF